MKSAILKFLETYKYGTKYNSNNINRIFQLNFDKNR